MVDVTPAAKLVANQRDHTLDVNPNVYTATLVEARKRALQRLKTGFSPLNGTQTVPTIRLNRSKLLEKMERETGIEPATSSLGSWHSTAELLPL